jgi:hypothetical protein
VAAVTWDNAALRVKDANDRAALVEREALERVSRAEAENTTVLDSTREDVKGFVRKIGLHEDDLAAERQAREASESNSRSSPVYKLEALSCVMPSSVPHG